MDEKSSAHRWNELTTDEVCRLIAENSAVLVDARSNSEYMGWKLKQDRGGHLPNAIDFSADWLAMGCDTAILRRLIQEKGLFSEATVVVYATQLHEAEAVADCFASQGVQSICLYDCRRWLETPSLPLERYDNYHLLIPPEVLIGLLSGSEEETFPNAQSPLIFEVSWGEAEDTDYREGHIPGAVHVNSDWFEPEEGAWRLDCDENLLKLAARLGITTEDTVIVAGSEPAPNCRFAIILRYLGVKDVRVLAGGLRLWKARGYPLSQRETRPVPVEAFGAVAPLHPEWILTTGQVRARLNDIGFTLVDTRSWAEYIGAVTGYSYHLHKGRVPGAVFAYDGAERSSDPSRYRNPDLTPKNREQVISMWDAAGIPLNNHLSFMCGGGWRAAEILWYAWVYGLNNTSLYSDGWCGWSNLGLPSLCGEPE